MGGDVSQGERFAGSRAWPVLCAALVTATLLLPGCRELNPEFMATTGDPQTMTGLETSDTTTATTTTTSEPGSSSTAITTSGTSGSSGTGDGMCAQPDQQQCGEDCVSTDLNVNHCGDCDQPCLNTHVCFAGECVLNCPLGQLACG